MAGIIERVKDLSFPEGEYVVIGSGLLDALGYRDAQDIDLVVSDLLYKQLENSSDFKAEIRYGRPMLFCERDEIEIWRDWKDDASFEMLKNTAVIIEGVAFAHPNIIIRRKQERGSEKDLQDIQRLKEYLES